MFSRFSHALVRPPAPNFADGLTTVDLGAPDVPLALRQHAQYCMALERNGCALLTLPPDPQHPDSTFVEDTALILPGRAAILTRPGAISRAGEVAGVSAALETYFPEMARIQAPGLLDAGDVCEAGERVFIGLSHRTNAAGAAQLTAWLDAHDIIARTIDIRRIDSILHLKSGMAAIDPERLVVIEDLADHPALTGFEVLRVPEGEEYGANLVRVNDVVFVSEGQPRLNAMLEDLDYELEILDMSEYRKMDGGLSCLSLRF